MENGEGNSKREWNNEYWTIKHQPITIIKPFLTHLQHPKHQRQHKLSIITIESLIITTLLSQNLFQLGEVSLCVESVWKSTEFIKAQLQHFLKTGMLHHGPGGYEPPLFYSATRWQLKLGDVLELLM